MMMMGSRGEQTSDVKKSRYELLWDATKLTSHGVLIAVSEDVNFLPCFLDFLCIFCVVPEKIKNGSTH